MSHDVRRSVRRRVAAALALAVIATSPADAADAPEKILGLHIFGSDSDGAPLRDRLLAQEFADLKRCDDTRKPLGVEDDSAERTREALKREVGLVKAERGLVDIEDADIWAREKFSCILKHALGLKKSYWKAKPRLEFFFSFNGGLNPQAEVTRLARESVGPILSDGKYPLFMIWPTGGLDAYGENLLDVRAGDRIKRNPLNLLTAVTQLAADGLKGVAGLPKTMENSVRYYADLRDSEEIGDLTVHSGVRNRLVAAGRNVSHSASVDEAGSPPPPLPTVVLRPATMALSDVGLAAWNNMVRRTRTAIHSTAEYPPKIAHQRGYARPDSRCMTTFPKQGYEPSFNLRRCYPLGAGAFSRFFQWYLACVDDGSRPEGSDACPLTLAPGDDKLLRDARFTFVGHSMGSIVINELIASYPSLPLETVVFMAGADSVRSTRKTLAPLLARNAGCTRFFNLMLHPSNDANERMAFGAIPKGSLLEYIDHYLDPAKTIDDRTIGKWINVRATRHMFAPAAQRWTLHQIFDRQSRGFDGRLAPARGEAGTPVTHGGFNDPGVPFWSERFWNPQSVKFGPQPSGCAKKFFAL